MKIDRFDWRLPLYAAVGALVLFVPVMVWGGDFFEFLYLLVVVPIISIVILIFLINAAIRKNGLRSLAILSMLIVYCAVSWSLFRNSFELRTIARWLFWSKDYKARVLAEPDSADGLLGHIEWDGWGFAGADTVAYLVFDPNDSLSTVASSHSPRQVS